MINNNTYNTDFIYISSGYSPVIHSQVITLLNYYQELNWFKTITFLCGCKNISETNNIHAATINAKYNVFCYKAYSNYSFFNYLSRYRLKKALLSTIHNNNTSSIIHIRGEDIAYMAYPIITEIMGRHFNVVVDIRGAGSEEYLEFYKKNLFHFFKLQNLHNSLKALYKYNKISAVSESLKTYLVKRSGIEEDRISIIPCFASSNFFFSEKWRIKYRKILGYRPEDAVVVFSSGGGSAWQETKMLEVLADKNIKILNLSKIKIDHPNIINKFVGHEEVPCYLSAADAGIIFRNNSIANKVALPVKFIEYLSAGLPVVANKHVDSISNFLDKTGFGILVENEKEIDKQVISKLKLISRRHICKHSQQFRVSAIARKYFYLYEK